MSYNNILFDLDGTITDPVIGITNGLIYSLNKYGIEISDRKELHKFIGPPLMYSFQNFYGFTKERAKEACIFYREYYNSIGKFENVVYNGLEELLIMLKENGKKLIVATSKPEVPAREIMEYFGLDKYFDYIAGSTVDGDRETKTDVINYALRVCKIKDLSATIMVGDRKYDIEGAKDVGISSIGVLYGYGDRGELEAAGADFIAPEVIDIGNIII